MFHQLALEKNEKNQRNIAVILKDQENNQKKVNLLNKINYKKNKNCKINIK